MTDSNSKGFESTTATTTTTPPDSSSAESIASDTPSDILVDDGEFAFLTSTYFDDVPQEDPKHLRTLTSQLSDQVYGRPLSKEDAADAVPPGGDGLIWHALVIPDNFAPNGKLLRGLNPRDFDLKDPSNVRIKPRRGSLPVTVTQLMSSLTKIDGPSGPRYIFNGILNGWPSLRKFELVSLQRKRTIGPITAPDFVIGSRLTWSHHWHANKEGEEGNPPEIIDQTKLYRAGLRGAPWTSSGWSPTSRHFVFWYEGQRPEGPRLTYGTDAIATVGDDKCSAVHMISHRYAVAKESTKDKVTYHSVVLLEWDHGKYCTIVEGAYLNGMGGYQGRSNWYDDKEEPVTELYKAFPPELVCPWLTTAFEVRCFDVKAKSLDEVKTYIRKYEGPDKRFIDPQFTFSHCARLTYRSKSNIAQYLANYISRDASYNELKRNCQTLSADLCSFLAGKKDVTPYHPINRFDYYNRTHLFLYDSSMFRTDAKSSLRGKTAR